MGRTKGTLICPKCRKTNPLSHDRVINGCRGHASHCGYIFPQDNEKRDNFLRRKKNGNNKNRKL